MTQPASPKVRLLICIALLALVFAAYARVGHFGYVYFDDPDYVCRNTHVTDGLTWSGFTWALTTGCASNWHPLTWISHMADCQFFGVNAGAEHLVNVGFHAANAILLFLLLTAMTGSIWASAFVAAVFALHPLQVESVAWIAERKSVLSTLFWMLTMLAYWRYRMKPGVGRYALVALFFALGLMAKPMLVTLPLVLLLMDFWPLGKSEDSSKSVPRAVANKIPLVLMTIASCIITLRVQQDGGMVRLAQDFPIGQRIANAIYSYAAYIGKMLWPGNLCIMYPHPKDTLPVWSVIASAAGLAVVTLLVIKARRKRPYLMAGWLWYLITLVPVIGLVQVGPQAMADRYAYIPMIGILVMLAWGVQDLLSYVKYGRTLVAIPAGLVLIVLVICTYVQTGYWRDYDTLFGRAMAVTGNNSVVRYSYASGLLKEGMTDDAIAFLRKTLAYPQSRAETHFLLGSIFAHEGRLDEAIAEDRAALRIAPDYALVENNLGVAIARKGDLAGAIVHLKRAIKLRPRYAAAYHSLGAVYSKQGDVKSAIENWKRAVEINPSLGDTHLRLAGALCQTGDYAGAWREVRAAQARGLQADPRLIDFLTRKLPQP